MSINQTLSYNDGLFKITPRAKKKLLQRRVLLAEYCFIEPGPTYSIATALLLLSVVCESINFSIATRSTKLFPLSWNDTKIRNTENLKTYF